jgi:hypothetical protein
MLEERGLLMRQGTIVDATIIAAPSSAAMLDPYTVLDRALGRRSRLYRALCHRGMLPSVAAMRGAGTGATRNCWARRAPG